MIYDIAYALSKMKPDARWVHRGEGMDYDGIEWQDESQRPSNQEIADFLDNINNLEPMRLLRIERDKLLQEIDWWAMADRTMSQPQKDYRQALRDLPDSSSPTLLPNGNLNKDSVVWPVKP
jgi:hypothetical protein